jgi:hypothetical protein
MHSCGAELPTVGRPERTRRYSSLVDELLDQPANFLGCILKAVMADASHAVYASAEGRLS